MLCEKKECTGCASCYNACPQNAIKMVMTEEGFLYPVVNEKKCIGCGACARACPCVTKIAKHSDEKITYYAARAKKEEKDSASGGMFAVMARNILRQNGLVYGAAFDENFNVVHRCIASEQDLLCLQGSKYVQSEIGAVLKSVKANLNEGKLVLFSGTPCQIAGLLSYLGGRNDNLLCVDVICHGVPAPQVWRKYLETFHMHKKIEKISFRDIKSKREKIFSVQYEGGKRYEKTYPNDPYIWGFCYDLFLRKSCYDCRYKGSERIADLTIGDAWGGEHYAPRIYDKDKGLSLVIVNSSRGRQFFQQVKNDLIYQEVNSDRAIKNNRCIIKSVTENTNRELFFGDLKKYSFKSVLLKYYWKAKIGEIKKRYALFEFGNQEE